MCLMTRHYMVDDSLKFWRVRPWATNPEFLEWEIGRFDQQCEYTLPHYHTRPPLTMTCWRRHCVRACVRVETPSVYESGKSGGFGFGDKG